MLTKNKEKSKWIPEIYYEENENGMSSHIPFISVPQEEEMPKILFIFEHRETGEYEPDDEGNEIPISELDLFSFANMKTLKEKLNYEDYDKVRLALGLESLKEASKKGKDISKNVNENINTIRNKEELH